MTKYKIIGILNLLIGIPTLLLSLYFSTSVIPKLSRLYAEFDVSNSGNIATGYVIVLILLTISIANVFLGIKGFSNTQKGKAYFKYGLIMAISTLFLGGLLIGLMTLIVVLPVYNLTTQF